MVVDADESFAANQYLPYCFDTGRVGGGGGGGGKQVEELEPKIKRGDPRGNSSLRLFGYFPASNRSP